jgi:ubiquitin C-terminal hydrolase
MLKTPDKYLVNSIFGGKTCSQIICKGGCGSVKKNYEDFYNLSLGVKGNKNLSEALIKYITGDTISDYFCDKCKKKVDVVKRTCIHDLPNVLIVHLQRIIFNFDTMMNEKINSKLEFPNELDLEPYTVEYLEKIDANNAKTSPIKEEHEGPPVEEAKVEKDPSYYKYKLAGVVVHYGTADAGHYYSYINTNRGSILHFSIL